MARQHLARFKLREKANMKTISPTLKPTATKPLTFGDLVAAIYSASNKRKARALLKFVVNTHLVVFPQSRQIVIA